MKDKIKLNEIVGYLPYGLKCHEYGECVGIREWIGWGLEFKDKTGSIQVPLSEIKPILHPLSDLTKEIENMATGENFVPLNRILESYCFDVSKMDDDYRLGFAESLIEIDMGLQTANMLYE